MLFIVKPTNILLHLEEKNKKKKQEKKKKKNNPHVQVAPLRIAPESLESLHKDLAYSDVNSLL